MNLSSALRTLADRVAEAETAGFTVRSSSINIHLNDPSQGEKFAGRVGIDHFGSSGGTRWVEGAVEDLGITVFRASAEAVSR